MTSHTYGAMCALRISAGDFNRRPMLSPKGFVPPAEGFSPAARVLRQLVAVGLKPAATTTKAAYAAWSQNRAASRGRQPGGARVAPTGRRWAKALGYYDEGRLRGLFANSYRQPRASARRDACCANRSPLG